MEYFLDTFLCGLVFIGEIIGAILLAILVQLIFYRIFKINLYKNIIKGLEKLEKFTEEVF